MFPLIDYLIDYVYFIYDTACLIVLLCGLAYRFALLFYCIYLHHTIYTYHNIIFSLQALILYEQTLIRLPLHQNRSVGDAPHHDGRLFVEEAVDRPHLHDISVDFGVSDLCEPGGAYTRVAYLHALFRAAVYLRVDVFLQRQLVERFRTHKPYDRAYPGNYRYGQRDETARHAQAGKGVVVGIQHATYRREAGQAEPGDDE